MAKATKTSYSAILGAVVAHHRTRAGLGQAMVARHLGVAPSSYSRLETGQTAWTVDMLFQISELLGIGVNELIQSVETAIGDVLSPQGCEVLPVARSNTTGSRHRAAGSLVAGAALGIVLAGMLDSD